MIQGRAVESMALAHRRDLLETAGGLQVARRAAASTHEAAGDAALGRRHPGCRWPSGAPGQGATSRRLADRLRDPTRRSVHPDLVSPGTGRPACHRRRFRARGCAIGKSGAMPAPRNVLFITVDQWRGDCLSALGHPVARRPRPSTRWPAGACSSPITGPTPPPAGPRGPASTPAPTSTGTGRCSTAPRSMPASPTWRSIAREAGTTRCSSATPTPRSIPRTVPPDDPRLFTYEGVLPGLPGADRGPLGAGQPGLGALAGRRRGSTCRPTRTTCTSRSRAFPGADEHGSTWAPARFPAELSQTTFVRSAVVEWLEQHGDEPFFVHASFIRPHPPRRNPVGYHDLYDGRGRRPIRRLRHPGGGGGHAPVCRHG